MNSEELINIHYSPITLHYNMEDIMIFKDYYKILCFDDNKAKTEQIKILSADDQNHTVNDKTEDVNVKKINI